MAGGNEQKYAPIFDECFEISYGGTYQDHKDRGVPRQLLGVDLVIGNSANTLNKPVHSPCSGFCRMLTDSTGAHYATVMESGGTFQHFLVHLNEFIGGNRHVEKGEIVGRAGKSGLATGEHVHYMIYQNALDIDPTSFINFDISYYSDDMTQAEHDALFETLKQVQNNYNKLVALQENVGTDNRKVLGDTYNNTVDIKSILNKILTFLKIK